MIDLTVSEAQLFRLLSSFFGKDHVVPQMSVLAVCGGELPSNLRSLGIDALSWARANACLFTIVDRDDNPRMVIELFSGFENSIDVKEAEHQRYLSPILRAAGVRYVTISADEFEEMLDPSSNLDFLHFLEAKVGKDEVDLA